MNTKIENILKLILIFCMVCGMLAAVMPMNALAQSEAVSYIYHQHIGEESKEGGCYRRSVYHAHQGSETTGGKCYGTPIYHVHTGTREAGGDCYSQPVYHIHGGSGDRAGGCYVEQYHKHADGCYTQATCTINTESISYCFRTWYATCYHHGNTVHGEWDATKKHTACGAGTFKSTVEICNACKHLGFTEHTYSQLTCNKGNEVVGYAPGCGKEGNTIEYYNPGCGRTEGVNIDRYGSSCEKTTQTIEKYGLDCGKDGTTKYGYVKITNLTQGKAKEVVLEASYCDYASDSGKEGEIKVKAVPFIWKSGSTGKTISEDSRITVKKNDSYTVILQAENADINPKSLSVTISVSNVEGTSGGQGDGKDEGNNNSGSGDDSKPAVSPSPEAEEKAVVATPEKSIEGKSSNDLKAKVAAVSASPQRAVSTPVRKETRIETKEIIPEERMASPEETVIVKQTTEFGQFWSSPTMKAIVISLGCAAALLGLIWLWILLFRYLGIYCEDGEGNLCFLGFGLIRKEETFLFTIPDRVFERAYTDRYCLKPGVLFCKKNQQEELIVHIKEKKVSLFVDKEMTFKY